MNHSSDLPDGWMPARLKPHVRPGLIVILLFVLTCGFYGVYWFYRVHEEHPRRATDPGGMQVLLNFLIPVIAAMPLLMVCRVHAEKAAELNLLHVWWVGMLLVTYSNVAFAYHSLRLSRRLADLCFLRREIPAMPSGLGASSLIIGVGIWVARYLVDGLHESGVPVPGFLLHSSTQALLRGLSIGFGLKWWLQAHKAANALSASSTARFENSKPIG